MPVATEVDDDTESEQSHGVARTLGMVAIVVVCLSIVLFWIWIFAGGPAKENRDRLDDRAFAERTEQRCQELRDDLATLPGPGEFTDAIHRADVLDEANEMVTEMVDDIEADAPTTGEDALRVKPWIEDWRRYIADREAYADALRTDPNAKLTITENPELRDGVDKTIEIFAYDANDIEACETPGDVG